MLIARNLAFYMAFYCGGVIYILAAMVVMFVHEATLQRIVRAWCNYHRWCLKIFVGITIRSEGEQVPGPVFYAIKHESFFEAIDAPANFDLPAPFAKRELFLIPGWGWAAKQFGCVPVAREEGAKALRAMVSAAKDMASRGRPLVIFPEGTRIAHGERGELRAGFAGLYKLIGLPVVPVAVNSGPLYHRRWKRPGVITYRYGAPIPPGLPRAEVEARVADAINALNDEPAADRA